MEIHFRFTRTEAGDLKVETRTVGGGKGSPTDEDGFPLPPLDEEWHDVNTTNHPGKILDDCSSEMTFQLAQTSWLKDI